MLLEWFRNIWAPCQPDGDHLWLSWLAAADHPSMTLQDLQMCEQYLTLPWTAKWPRWLVRWREKDWSATTGWSLALVCSSSRPSPFSTTILAAQLKRWMDFAATLFHGISQHDWLETTPKLGWQQYSGKSADSTFFLQIEYLFDAGWCGQKTHNHFKLASFVHLWFNWNDQGVKVFGTSMLLALHRNWVFEDSASLWVGFLAAW